MIILNSTHPLTPEHVAQVKALMGYKANQAIDFPVQFENQRPFPPQLEHLMAQTPQITAALQTESILVKLPSLKDIAALVPVDLHGRIGHFLPILRMRPVVDSMPSHFEVAEIISLQVVGDTARRKQLETQ
jgi:hypothetical protein